MLRHPAPWLGLAAVRRGGCDSVFDSRRGRAPATRGCSAALSPLLLGVSLASVSAFGREHVPVADDAPMEPIAAGRRPDCSAGCPRRGWWRWSSSRARSGCGCAAASNSATSRAAPRTPTTPCPSCCSRCCWPASRSPLGAAVVHVVRQRLAASIVLFLLVPPRRRPTGCSTGSVARWLRRVQSQPIFVEVGPGDADPSTLPVHLAALRAGGVPGLLGAAGRVARSWRPGTTSTWSR